LPSDCQFRRQTVANLEDDVPVAQWSRGFLHGHQWLEESWEAYVPGALDEEFAAMLMALSFFASKDLCVTLERLQRNTTGTARPNRREIFERIMAKRKKSK